MAETSKLGGSQDGRAILPVELVVWEILVRLPVKTLLCCRAVCRSWHCLTSMSDFVLAHHRHQPSLPLVCSLISDALDVLDIRQRPIERWHVLRLGNNRKFHVHASCDGLILLSANCLVYLCNPFTRQWIPLPSLNSTHIMWMYSHGPSGEYRVLYWEHADKPSFYVLTVGSSAKPRRIEQPFASPSVQLFVEGGLSSGLSSAQGPAILLHDCLHLFTNCHFAEAIVVFHTVTESFRLMHLPKDAPRLLLSPCLHEVDGTLGLSWGSESMLKLCVLQDYQREAWSLMYQIEYPLAEMKGARIISLRGRIVSDDGDALIDCHRSYQQFHLGRNGKLLQTFQWQDLPPVSGFRFKGSLISHAFFERPRQGGRSRQP